MTPRYAVWQNAQQLPLFLQGELKGNPAGFFGWLLAGLAWLLAGFLAGLVWFGLVWFGSWLAFWLAWAGEFELTGVSFQFQVCCEWLPWLSGWFGLASGWLLAGLVWLMAGFLAGLVWLMAGFLAGLVWLLAGFLAGLVWLMAGFLAGLVWLMAGWLSFFPVFFSSPSKPARKPARSQPKKPARVSFELALQKRSCWAFCQTAYLGVIILQPHACAQRFRLRILRRTRSNAGRTSARSLSGRI